MRAYTSSEIRKARFDSNRGTLLNRNFDTVGQAGKEDKEHYEGEGSKEEGEEGYIDDEGLDA